MNEVFIGRQPIVDSEKRIAGFELLFRAQDSRSLNVTTSLEATSAVLNRLLTDTNIEEMCGNKPAFINVDHKFLEKDLISLLPKDKVVLELLETTEFTPEIVERIAKLSEIGYVFALDDYTEDWIPETLKDFISYVKVDILQVRRMERLERIVSGLRNYPVRILAEKVESHEMFNFLKNQGVELFQGYFFSKPEILRKRTLIPEKAQIVDLIKDLHRERDTRTIYAKIKRSPEISFKVLKLANSPAFYRGQQFSSLWQAILTLGTKNLRELLLLLLLSSDFRSIESDPILERAIFRASFMEALCSKIESSETLIEASYLCGLISLLDVALGTPLNSILDELKLSREIKEALTQKKGVLGILLEIVLKSEEGSMDGIEPLLRVLGLEFKELFASEEKAAKETVRFLETESSTSSDGSSL